MLEQNFLKEVRRALFRQGVWGTESRNIVEQLSDHFHEARAERIEDGESSEVAEKNAIAILGTPAVIAETASAQLRRESVFTRHPWIFAGGGFFLLTYALWILVFLGVLSSLSGVSLTNPDSSFVLRVALANWAPFLIACGVLAYWSRRSYGSWKSLFIASAAIGLAASSPLMAIFPPLHGPGSGSIAISVVGWLGLLVKAVLHSEVPFFQFSFGSLAIYVKLLLPVVIVAAARYWLPRIETRSLAGN
jgi:hypothetical protein